MPGQVQPLSVSAVLQTFLQQNFAKVNNRFDETILTVSLRTFGFK
jgi:hypothetical protein